MPYEIKESEDGGKEVHIEGPFKGSVEGSGENIEVQEGKTNLGNSQNQKVDVEKVQRRIRMAQSRGQPQRRPVRRPQRKQKRRFYRDVEGVSNFSVSTNRKSIRTSPGGGSIMNTISDVVKGISDDIFGRR